ncbi:hypothetical protein CH306_14255 [Rhodococcus sp. 15-725-2-2b]|uniref:hypothetical protein n=1 Tax=unclassified Rhodococcus (in: high G+C Gram-positive bacteria) TaxID=192944 RepID=UPI000B9B9AC0|nr:MULTISPECIES: hypothetical protein [unclassified Rhodococcus (in: high G+C Gram-positive bacteria)]OZC66434.1 hypothetical protein CH277_15900 [Rhodococcus sp. 06-469-3-2]OZD45081.1 hypothetical protein CH264_11785 [Rhodococcus sp. 06-1477-1A]OZE15587.1 hypothetical protein CH249_03520 [Rhodococcus sp. 05-2255-3B1]OZE16189.1 hypothetical protein CH250_01710 [Rhodococcus sp. 05-2255-3C]OZE21310.1 hypothetical protein CH255_08255 [Rhodococcus sp. 05-2255-2A2]
MPANDPTERTIADRDVEKRWNDPVVFRRAAGYCAVVVAVAAALTALFLVVDRTNPVLAASVPAVRFLGGIGALTLGYRSYRAGGTWPIWQGAAWLLFTVMLLGLAMPMFAIRQ